VGERALGFAFRLCGFTLFDHVHTYLDIRYIIVYKCSKCICDVDINRKSNKRTPTSGN